MRIEIHPDLSKVDSAQWNALVEDNNPLIKHEFLSALEQNNCVGPHFGWLPRHILVFDTKKQLVAAMPLYEKHNSLGEFVFDHAWVQAYENNQLSYYPKLVSSVPYTPCSGGRLLCKEGEEQHYSTLLATMLTLVTEHEYSSAHVLFPKNDQHQWIHQQGGFLSRQDCQFHWHNLDYQDFEGFLDKLTAKKRKNIRQERRRVREAGIEIQQLNGHQAQTEDWQRFEYFYQKTFETKWGVPTLNAGFFEQIAKTLPEQTLLVNASLNGEVVASALMFHSDTTLYGRYWGCEKYIDCLHFEACYYQGIEYCIANGLQHFEPGAQGEHKVMRGFIPTRTHSSHWIQHDGFRSAIAKHCEYERQHIDEYIQQVLAHVPYKQEVLDTEFQQRGLLP